MSNSGLSTRGKAIVDDEDVSKLQFGRGNFLISFLYLFIYFLNKI